LFYRVALPEKYQQEFEVLLEDISKICPPLELVDPKLLI